MEMPSPATPDPVPFTARWALLAGGLLLLAAGLAWLQLAAPDAGPPAETPQPIATDPLAPGTVAAMSSPALHFSDGWQISAAGADPTEPADPWRQPAGSVAFTYSGRDLALALAEGDYWAYLYVTVDDAPANQLSSISGNLDSRGQPAGYKTLLAPELDDNGPTVRWHHIHRAPDDGPHTVHIELWRGWGETPLRGVAADAMVETGFPRWPSVLLLVSSAWLFLLGLIAGATPGVASVRQRRAHWTRRQAVQDGARIAALTGLVALVGGTVAPAWPLALAGLAILGGAALVRPAYWAAALLLGLPFYFSVKLPLLPNRAFELTDVGVAGGFLLLCFILATTQARPGSGYSVRNWPFGLLMALVTWAFVSATDAAYPALALREWRTVFLAGALFALFLISLLQRSADAQADRRLLIGAWVAGAFLVSLVACGQYLADTMVIPAEGVRRVRGLYGSPNNLALYLDRTLAVTLALALFDCGRRRVVWGIAAVAQGAALLLTFSKGALLLAMPAMLLVLWGGGYWLLGQRDASRRMLWWLAGVGGVAVLALLPFAGTERFQRLFDLRTGTGFLRLQLWRSAVQMALDHAVTGVGPDNFLYAFRSGYLLPAAWQEPNLNHPHNWLLDWWTRLGIPGLLLGLGYWLAGGRRILLRFRSQRSSPFDQALALGLLAAFAAALAHGLIDASYALPDLMLVWVLMAFVAPGSDA